MVSAISPTLFQPPTLIDLGVNSAGTRTILRSQHALDAAGPALFTLSKSSERDKYGSFAHNSNTDYGGAAHDDTGCRFLKEQREDTLRVCECYRGECRRSTES